MQNYLTLTYKLKDFGFYWVFFLNSIFYSFAECEGFHGLNCSIECAANYYGRQCREKCDCPSDKYCDNVRGCLCNTTSINCTEKGKIHILSPTHSDKQRIFYMTCTCNFRYNSSGGNNSVCVYFSMWVQYTFFKKVPTIKWSNGLSQTMCKRTHVMYKTNIDYYS